jgi:hypothetical protein
MVSLSSGPRNDDLDRPTPIIPGMAVKQWLYESAPVRVNSSAMFGIQASSGFRVQSRGGVPHSLWCDLEGRWMPLLQVADWGRPACDVLLVSVQSFPPARVVRASTVLPWLRRGLRENRADTRLTIRVLLEARDRLINAPTEHSAEPKPRGGGGGYRWDSYRWGWAGPPKDGFG